MPTLSRTAARFKERTELLEFMLEAASAATETLDLDRLLAQVAEIIKKVIPYDLLAIMLYSERRQGLSIRHSIGHRPELAKTLLLRLGEGITGTAAAERQPTLVDDVRNDKRYLSVLDAVRSELAVPMIARGKLVGVIDLQSTKLSAFTKYDKDLLTLISSRIAYSIDNARLYRRADRQNKTLRTLSRLSREFSSILALDENLPPSVAQALAILRFPITHVTDHVGRGTPDEDLFDEAAARNWVLVTRDAKMWRKRAQQAALLQAGIGG